MKKTIALILTLIMVLSMTVTAFAEGDSSEADPFDREPYKIAYLCNDLSWVWNKTISDNLEKLGEKYNYEYTSYACLNDFDAYINQIYTMADNGYQGFVIGSDDVLAPRAYEACQELGVAFVAESTAFVDEAGNCIWPSVEQDQYYNGALCVEWLGEHYKDYWGDIDTSKLGLIVLDFSTVSGIHAREPGAVDKFNELFPDAADNYVPGDLLALGNEGFSLQGANNLTTTLLSNNPDIEYWFIVANVDDWAQGAARAAETLEMTDRVLVTSVQSDAFLKEMESTGGDTPYVAAAAVSSSDFSIYMAQCVVSLLDGTETAETIWPEYVEEGSSYPIMKVQATMITKDTYEDYLKAEQEKLQ